MMQDQKGCNKNTIRAEEEQITAARATRAKQHENEEEDTGIRSAGRENKGTKRESRQKEQTSKQHNKCHCYRFRAPPIKLNENKQKIPFTVELRAIIAHVPLISRTGTLPHDLPFLSLIHI